MSADQAGQTDPKSKGTPKAPSPKKEGPVTSLFVRLAALVRFRTGEARADRVTSGDVGTALAHERTDLALDRSYLAAERTLMAWIRTALSMISFGFTIGKLGQVLHDVQVKGLLGGGRTVSLENLAYYLVILGTVALVAASLQHWHRLRELRSMGLGRERSITLFVALILTLVGGFALTALALAL